MTALDDALSYADEHAEDFLERLKDFARIPGISAWPSHAAELQRSAEFTRDLLAKAGLDNTQLLEFEGAPPYAYGEWLGAEGKPTLLLYAHHDVQPPGEEQAWNSPPFEPTERDGPGGRRLYGRGAADDKAGALVHAAAIEAWLKTEGSLPCNIKVIIEGEEEVGSTHLAQCLVAHRELLDADIMVLTDTLNFAIGHPSLTYSLRGMVSMEVELRTIDHAVHSGMWGGPCIDPLSALCKLLGSLHDDEGCIAVPGFLDDIREASDWERERIAQLGYDEAKLREESGLLDGTRLTGESDRSVLERIWLRPAISVIALDACPMDLAANKLLPYARAKLSCRIVPNQEPAQIIEHLKAHLRAQTPYGAELTIRNAEGVAGWVCVPEGPAFEAAERALSAAFDHEVAFIGCGGSIPFVGPFAEAFGGAPAILLGIEDPFTNAHGENESLHIGDFHKAIAGNIRLFAELAGVDIDKADKS